MQMGQFGDERVVVPQLMACQKILKKEKKAFPSRSPPPPSSALQLGFVYLRLKAEGLVTAFRTLLAMLKESSAWDSPPPST
jgi:hypothetical protein